MQSLKGSLLIATPELDDPNFARTVLLIIEHNEDGAMALILNRPTTLNVANMWSQVSEVPCKHQSSLLEGGPCAGAMSVLHGCEELADMRVLPGVYFSADEDSLTQLVGVPVDPVLFFGGYAGWSAGQLEGEIDAGAWTYRSASRKQIFERRFDHWPWIQRRMTIESMYPWINTVALPNDPLTN